MSVNLVFPLSKIWLIKLIIKTSEPYQKSRFYTTQTIVTPIIKVKS